MRVLLGRAGRSYCSLAAGSREGCLRRSAARCAIQPAPPPEARLGAPKVSSAGAPPAHGALVTVPVTRTGAEPDRSLAGGLRRSAYDYSVGPLQRAGGGL